MGVNDAAWEKLFDKYRILEEIGRKGCFPISAAQIKEFREPRLMTKFDHRVNLPAVFAEKRPGDSAGQPGGLRDLLLFGLS